MLYSKSVIFFYFHQITHLIIENICSFAKPLSHDFLIANSAFRLFDIFLSSKGYNQMITNQFNIQRIFTGKKNINYTRYFMLTQLLQKLNIMIHNCPNFFMVHLAKAANIFSAGVTPKRCSVFVNT